jgi:hypothetical protein
MGNKNSGRTEPSPLDDSCGAPEAEAACTSPAAAPEVPTSTAVETGHAGAVAASGRLAELSVTLGASIAPGAAVTSAADKTSFVPSLDAWSCLSYANVCFGDRLAVVDLAPPPGTTAPAGTAAAPVAPSATATSPEADRLLTYAQLHDRSVAAAAALLAVGVRQGSRVAVMLRNCSEVMELHYAAALLRAVVVNVVRPGALMSFSALLSGLGLGAIPLLLLFRDVRGLPNLYCFLTRPHHLGPRHLLWFVCMCCTTSLLVLGRPTCC